MGRTVCSRSAWAGAAFALPTPNVEDSQEKRTRSVAKR
jgi:hypothetical protein